MVTLRVNSMLNHYRILKNIGEGSSGQVFVASDPRGQLVVLKCIPLKNSWFQREFEREVHSLSKCGDCPLIVNMLHSFKYKTYGVIVLEKLRGDLLDYLQQRQPLGIDYVKNVFFQICVAVLYIHKRCIAHLDIKPENIFLSGPSTVKLGDFGSSYVWQDGGEYETKLGAVGTSYYCAPEVGPNIQYNPRKADMWSLGILLHVLLTGFWPYRGNTEEILHTNVKHGNTSLFTDSLPKDSNLMELLEGLLQHNPESRYSINDALSSKWLSSIGKRNKNKLRGGSTPILQSYSEDEEKSDSESESKPGKEKQELMENTPNSFAQQSSGVFAFSDEEMADIGASWDDDSDDERNLSFSDSIAPYSLPNSLESEPIKQPRKLVNPEPNMLTTTLLAPINKIAKIDKQKQKPKRRASLLQIFSKKTRRSTTPLSNSVSLKL